MSVFSRTIVLVSLVGAIALCAPAAGTAGAGGYVGGFRAAYLPVVRTLQGVSGACPNANTVAQLPACAARVAPFRTALAGLHRFVTQTAPPAQAKTDVRTLVASIRLLQQRFTKLAGFLKQKDLARFKAMGGEGSPIRNAIGGFISAVQNLVIDLPQLRVPVP